MSARSAARRYASVLFEVADASGALPRVETELNFFVALLDEHPELQDVLAFPTISAQKKRAVIDQVLTAAGDFSGEVRRLLLLLADRERLGLVRQVAAAYTARLMAHRNIMQAHVVTATALQDGARATLTQALSAAAGADVRIEESVDPAIMGGIVARLGGVVYDASLTRQLGKMRQQLLVQG